MSHVSAKGSGNRSRYGSTGSTTSSTTSTRITYGTNNMNGPMDAISNQQESLPVAAAAHGRERRSRRFRAVTFLDPNTQRSSIYHESEKKSEGDNFDARNGNQHPHRDEHDDRDDCINNQISDENGIDYDLDNNGNNVPIHYKAALSRQVSWKYVPTAIPPNSDSYGYDHNRFNTRKCQRISSVTLGLILICIALTACIIDNVSSFYRPIEHFIPPKQSITDLPFPTTTRSAYNQYGSPDNIFDMSLFTADVRKTLFPFPTGAFWTNFVLKPNPLTKKKKDKKKVRNSLSSNKNNHDPSSTYPTDLSNPIVVYPYAFKWSPTTLALSYPSFRRIVQPLIVQDVFWPDVSISAREGIVSRKIVHHDHLSVAVRMYSPKIATQGNAISYFETYMVQGSPYVTMKSLRSSPQLRALTVWDHVECIPMDQDHDLSPQSQPSQPSPNNDNEQHTHQNNYTSYPSCVIKMADDQVDFSTSFTGLQFLLTQTEGQRWILFVINDNGTPVRFFFSSDLRDLFTAEPFTGVLRLAFIPPGAELNGDTVRHLLLHSNVYPISATVSQNYQEKRKIADFDTATVKFSYQVKKGKMNNAKNHNLLMLALPHHKHALQASDAKIPTFDADYRCIKGNMIPVIGNEWIAYNEQLTNMELESSSRIKDKHVIEVIHKNLQDDINMVIPTAQDIYGFGKQIARLAQLAQIAHELDVDRAIVRNLVNLVYTYLTDWLDGNNDDKFLFDKDLGGIVSKTGLQDPTADFGNGWYSDHHYHYGYYIYAATILSRLHSTFFHEYAPHISTLIHDIANESPISTVKQSTSTTTNSGPRKELHELFPSVRHKSWYDGHSWASGLFEQINGKSQESSSEAVNAYFATYLWQSINGDKKAINFARLLLATEIRSAQTYWHTGPSNSLYPPVLAENYMIGNVGGLDVTSTTRLSDKISYVHLINFLPLTAITNELFPKSYVKGEYNFLEPIILDSEQPLQSYMAALHGILDPAEAWVQAQNLTFVQLDLGVSKSEVLYWIATKTGLGTKWNISQAVNPERNSS